MSPPPCVLFGSGEVAGRAACDVEVGESSGREGCEGELGVAHDEDRRSGLRASDPPPVLYRFGEGSGLLAGCHGVQVGKLGGG